MKVSFIELDCEGSSKEPQGVFGFVADEDSHNMLGPFIALCNDDLDRAVALYRPNSAAKSKTEVPRFYDLISAIKYAQVVKVATRPEGFKKASR